MKNRILSLFLVIAIVAVATCAWAYTLQYSTDPTTGAGYFMKWTTGTTPVTVTMVYNLTFPSQSSFVNPTLVQAVLRNDMLNIWNGTLKANNIPVRFADGGTTTVSDLSCNGTNMITFSNSNAAYTVPNGVLAYTYLFAVVSPGLVAAGTCGPNAINTTFVGQIFDAAVTFSTSQTFSTDGRYVSGTAASQADDIEGTALHELGHVLGLHHSTLNSALMIAAVQQGFPNRSMNSDDIAGINAAYGVNNLGGSVSGKVVNTTGSPVFGAVVNLTNSTTGVPTVGAITDSTGAYSMVGFAPGTYNIWVKPLDAYPTSPGNFTVQYNTAPATAFNAQAVPGTITVASTGTLTIPNIQVNIPYSATFEDVVVETTVGNATLSFGGAVSSARRAGVGSSYPSNTGAYSICAFGVGLAGTIATSVPNAVASGSTITSGCGVGALLAQNFTFPASTVPGFYDVYTSNDVMPSSLQITTNPFVPSNGIVDSAANTTTYAAGAFISIYGLDLTTQTITNSVFPVPTQMGGVSVRVGDRFAPLFFVSPGQVNAMIPYEAGSCPNGGSSGCPVDVQVQVGSNSLYDYGNITVVPSAPKIFSIDSSGKGQGAIQDGSAPGCPAACPIANSSNPASAGDILVIYASGLGQTTPAAIDGLAGTGTTALASVTFSAGTTTKTVQSVYTGVTSCCSALYQVNVAVPTGLGVGPANVQLTDSSGNKSNTVTVAVH
jgi:uncharacterized protein (TIGR03437 family)